MAGQDAPRVRRGLGLLLILAALLLSLLLSLMVGSTMHPLGETWRGLIHPDDSQASVIVWSLRVPRTVLAVVVGIAYGIAGALIQAITRNPLADTGILGVNAGAGFAVTLGVACFGAAGHTAFMWWAMAGALVTTVLVHLIGSGGRLDASPVTLVLAGVALGAVLGVVAVTLLAGTATALTGGIGFVGLMVPHVVRWFTGPDQRWVLACSALSAPVLVVLSDVLGRVIVPSGELQVGIVTAILGAPVLIVLVRRRRVSGL
ncbi:iron ABC transporter permease [Arachnia propionica]|uniref:Iron ABC transporter permease n=1 Tax=Arachnia propionica TaxID=1750 RepID=A0A3P1T290_9ACTN|nr:iron chelate uptake ABC transporter family permease subunit [Arachnia propionica]RRD03561.1 iron ABC transporter permease [Arachnia propionica]